MSIQVDELVRPYSYCQVSFLSFLFSTSTHSSAIKFTFPFSQRVWLFVDRETRLLLQDHYQQRFVVMEGGRQRLQGVGRIVSTCQYWEQRGARGNNGNDPEEEGGSFAKWPSSDSRSLDWPPRNEFVFSGVDFWTVSQLHTLLASFFVDGARKEMWSNVEHRTGTLEVGFLQHSLRGFHVRDESRLVWESSHQSDLWSTEYFLCTLDWDEFQFP